MAGLLCCNIYHLGGGIKGGRPKIGSNGVDLGGLGDIFCGAIDF